MEGARRDHRTSTQRERGEAAPDRGGDQLRLIGSPESGTGSWRLSRATREVGRRGIEQARAALRAARRHDDAGDAGSSHPTAA